MTSRNILLPLFTAILLVTSCKQDTKKSDSTATTTPAASATMAKPAVWLYAVTVDNLRMRQAPDQKAAQVTTISEGDFVVGEGKASPNTEEIELRGVLFNEPYYEVTGTTPEQHKGWAYGGGLRLVYTGSAEKSPDLGKLTQLANHFKSLDVKKLESNKKAWDYLTANFADASGASADAAYIMYEGFSRRMQFEGELYKITEAMTWSTEDMEAVYNMTFDMNKNPKTKQFADYGFRLATAEGMVFPVTDLSRVQAFFQPKLTPPMQAFMNQRVIEDKSQDSSDGGLIIPLDELAGRAAFWENFNKNNPWFPLSIETKESERWMLASILNGMNNTPIADYETKQINEDFKKLWTDIQQKYPGTNLAAQCKTLADLCAAEGWKQTARVEEWQTKTMEALYKTN
jgi:hypothetical protein